MAKLISKNQGLTLIELLVTLALGLLIALAAITALLLSQQGYRSVDAASQLRDNARFATDLIRRVVLQTGYLDTHFALARGHEFALPSTGAEPHIKGFNNARYNQALVIGTTNQVGTGNNAKGINGSDMLIIRYQVGSTLHDNVADGTMINCAGMSEDLPPSSSDERLISVFHVATSANNEPSLMCTRRNESTGNWATDPLIEGVESFQVLYGVYAVTPNTAPNQLNATDVTPAAERYLRADQLVVSGDDEATRANWARVSSIRVGMVLRGQPDSAPIGESITLNVLGSEGFSTAEDIGSIFTVSPNDGRLRQAINFTIHLRNLQKTL